MHLGDADGGADSADGDEVAALRTGVTAGQLLGWGARWVEDVEDVDGKAGDGDGQDSGEGGVAACDGLALRAGGCGGWIWCSGGSEGHGEDGDD